MSHSSQVNIKIGGFASDVEVTLEYGSRQVAEAFGVVVGTPRTLTNEAAFNALTGLHFHGYRSLIVALIGNAEDARSVYGDEDCNWLEIAINHFD